MPLSRSFRHRILYDKHQYKAIYFETVFDGVSYLLIPRYNVFGAAVAQAINALITSALYIFFSARQKVFVLDKKNCLTIFLILLSFFALLSWEIALIVVLIGVKALGIVNKEDIAILERFSPKQIKKLMYVLKIFAR